MAKAKHTTTMLEDQLVLNLIAEVNRRKAEIAKATGRPNYQTNMTFSYSEGRIGGDSINLNAQSELKALINIAAFLQNQEIGYTNAATMLGVEKVPIYKHGGYTASEWFNDIKMRVTKIQLNEKQAALTALEARLERIISPELRRKMELEQIALELA